MGARAKAWCLLMHAEASLSLSLSLCLAAVATAAAEGGAAPDLPLAGKSAEVPLKLMEFCGSVARLAWAKANGCPWGGTTCAYVAVEGRLEVLQWARGREDVCRRRSGRAPGDQETLKSARAE